MADNADPKLANLAAVVQNLITQLDAHPDAPQLAVIADLLQSLSPHAGPANPEELLGELEKARADAKGAIAQLSTLSDEDLSLIAQGLGPQANPKELLGLGNALAEAWRKQDGAAVERLLRQTRQTLGDDSEAREEAERTARIQASVKDSIARNLRAVGIRPLTTGEDDA